MEGLLKDASLLQDEVVVAPDVALYEVINAVWKHEKLLRDLKDGRPYVRALLELVESGQVRLVRPWPELVEASYDVAEKHKITFYDSVFICLANLLDLELKTFDRVLGSE